MLGNSYVGKSSIICRYNNSNVSEQMENKQTIGVGFSLKKIITNDEKNEPLTIKLQIWDTAGQERFRSIISSYYRGSHICCLCFEPAKPDEIFDQIVRWIDQIREHVDIKQTMIYLLMTKYDKYPQMKYEQIKLIIDRVEHLYGVKYVRFIGFCSAFDDNFIQMMDRPYIEIFDKSNLANHEGSIDSTDPPQFIRSIENMNLGKWADGNAGGIGKEWVEVGEQSKIYSIDQMFKMIVDDFLTRLQYLNIVKSDEKKDEVKLSDHSIKSWLCCS
jgi:small GTP-binding protein